MSSSCRATLRTLLFMLCMGLSVCVPCQASADEKKTLTLDECITRAVAASAQVREAQYEVSLYVSKKDQADSARYPQVEIVAYGSLSPEARLRDGRTVESTTNINDRSYDGVFGRAIVQLVQPVYTFGKISGYREAAGHGVAAYEAGAKLKATEVALQVRHAYYGLLLGREIKFLLTDLGEELDKSIEKVQKKLDDGAPGVDLVDLFKLQTIKGELDRYIAQADEGIGQAQYGLRALMDMPEGEEFEIADEYLIPAEYELGEFRSYREAALSARLEFTQLREGLLAREALIDVERADYYPHFFIYGFGSIAGATNRDHLNNPYIFDEFNHATAGAVLGFKWAIDLGMNRGQVDEARAEYLKLRAKQDYAHAGVPYQVREAYLALERAEAEMDALMAAYKTAKQWVVAALANFDLGVGDARDIADSVRSYGSIRADYFRAVFNQRMAIANLEHATGSDAGVVPYSATRREPSKDMKGEGI